MRLLESLSLLLLVGNLASPAEAGLEGSSIIGKNKAFLSVLRNWLKPIVQSNSSSWKRCWRATVDGDAASTFHSQCDAKGPTVTIIQVDQYIFGGYTSTSWNSSSCGFQYDSKPFLFSLVNKPGWGPVKLSPPGSLGSSSFDYAIYSCSSSGPSFGFGHDIHIADYAGSNICSYTRLGNSYAEPPLAYSYGNLRLHFVRTFLAGTYQFLITEVETFYEST